MISKCSQQIGSQQNGSHPESQFHGAYMGPRTQGAVSIRKTVLPGMAIPMLKIRRPNGRLIFNIGIAIPI